MRELIVLAGGSGIALAATVSAQLLLWRFTTAKSLVVLLAVAGISFVVTMSIASVRSGLSPSDVLGFSLPLFALLLLGYLHLYIGLYRSLSVRILGELWEAGGVLTDEALERRYPLAWMFTSRLDLLERKGWLEVREGKYRCRPKARVAAAIYSFLRKLYGVRQAG